MCTMPCRGTGPRFNWKDWAKQQKDRKETQSQEEGQTDRKVATRANKLPEAVRVEAEKLKTDSIGKLGPENTKYTSPKVMRER